MNRNITFDPVAFDDLMKWSAEHPKLIKRVFELLNDIRKTPFTGIGKPEGLKHQFKGCWSRRITEEHRLIYKVNTDGGIYVLSVHGHYDD